MLMTTLIFWVVMVAAIPVHAASICGHVTDSATALPVEGAGVFLGDAAGNYLDQYAATDAQGYYCLDGLFPGTYSIEVKIDDYRAAYVTGIEVADDISTVPIAADMPAVLLEDPWPNPASSQINFRLQVQRPVDLEMSIFDARGRMIRAWSADALEPGPHRYQWDGRDRRGRVAAAGLYLVRIRTADTNHSRTFILTR